MISLPDAFADNHALWKKYLDEAPWSSVFLTPEWQGTWWQQFGDGAELHLLRIIADNVPVGIAPLMQRGTTLSFVGDSDLFDYHDFVTNDSVFYQSLAQSVSLWSWSTFELTSIPAFSETLNSLPPAFQRLGYKVVVETEDVVPGLNLANSWDEYLSNLRKKDRHELRRKLRRIEAAGQIQLKTSSPESLKDDFLEFKSMMMESQLEKRDFMSPERERFFWNIVVWASDAGFLRLFFLELNGERVAASLSFDYKGRRLLYNSGYRLKHGMLSVGLVLHALCIKDAISNGLTYFDFLRGPEPYKYHLGGQDVVLYKLIVRQ